MLEDVAEHHRVEAGGRKLCREEVLGAHVKPELAPGVLRRKRRGFHAHRQPPTIPSDGEKEADPAAEVEQRARRLMALNPLEDSAAGLALARFFLDVVRRLGVGICRLEQSILRHPSKLHVPAVAAAGDVGHRRAELQRRRDKAFSTYLPADR